MRLAAPLAVSVLAAALLLGCGGSSSPESGTAPPPASRGPIAPAGASARACSPGPTGVRYLRATHAGCAEARQVAAGWRRARECDKLGSRSGCSLRSYRCSATATDRGWSVSCSKPGRSIAFAIRRG